MNRSMLLALLLLTSCGGASVPDTPPLQGARIGGPFSLVNQDGRTVTDAEFAGKYRIVYFGYTFCPDICPTDVANLVRGYQLFGKRAPGLAAKVRPIFISVDPERDTPAVLKAFTAAFDPRLTGLSGSAEATAAVAKGYGVSYTAQKVAGASGYLVDHSRAAYLMAPDGKPLALLPHDGSAEEIADELAKWVA